MSRSMRKPVLNHLYFSHHSSSITDVSSLKFSKFNISFGFWKLDWKKVQSGVIKLPNPNTSRLTTTFCVVTDTADIDTRQLSRSNIGNSIELFSSLIKSHAYGNYPIQYHVHLIHSNSSDARQSNNIGEVKNFILKLRTSCFLIWPILINI